MNSKSIIVAMGENRTIGKDGDLPWGRDLPADLSRFKEKTVGKPIIMGRKTYESLPNGPLPDRQNIVMSRQRDLLIEGCTVANSTVEAMSVAANSDEVVIIGGEKIYSIFIPFVDTIYRTIVHDKFEGDTHFPELREEVWDLVENERHEPDENNMFPYTFQTLRRLAVA